VTGTGSPAQADRPDRWEDEAALRALLQDYAAAADDRDGVRYAELFEPDGTLVAPNYPDDLRPVKVLSGRETLRQVSEALQRFERTFHQVTNARFTIEGDRASGEVQCTAHHLLAAGDAGRTPRDDGSAWIDHVWFIRYRDQYVRSPDGWRFARRVLELQWVEEHPVVRVGPPPAGRSGRQPGGQPAGTGAGGGAPT
jgi:uncharacterized protein (TIGR02246 family)